MINIELLPKEMVLAYLYNHAKLPTRHQVLNKNLSFKEYQKNPEAWPHDPMLQFSSRDMSFEQGKVLIAKQRALGSLNFSDLYGRKLYVNLSKDEFNPCHYDKHNGKGTAKLAIQRLRKTANIPEPEPFRGLKRGWFSKYCELTSKEKEEKEEKEEKKIPSKNNVGRRNKSGGKSARTH